MLRILNILIETSDAKAPPNSDLGSTMGVFTPTAPDSRGNGHVTRNIRLILETIDMVGTASLGSSSVLLIVA
jgi:hypothetical protein